jgi:hypothetical protein
MGATELSNPALMLNFLQMLQQGQQPPQASLPPAGEPMSQTFPTPQADLGILHAAPGPGSVEDMPSPPYQHDPDWFWKKDFPPSVQHSPDLMLEPAVFNSEGPQYYDQAYQQNAPFATPGPYQTQLPAQQETDFRGWLKNNNVPFDPNADKVDYDMRGYYQAMRGGKEKARQGGHFTDKYKTPYDTTFSAESKYATPDNPFVWKNDKTLIDKRTGAVVFSAGGAKL